MGNKNIFKISCEGELFLVMQGETWLEFGNLAMMTLCCESHLILFGLTLF